MQSDTDDGRKGPGEAAPERAIADPATAEEATKYIVLSPAAPETLQLEAPNCVLRPDRFWMFAKRQDRRAASYAKCRAILLAVKGSGGAGNTKT